MNQRQGRHPVARAARWLLAACAGMAYMSTVAADGPNATEESAKASPSPELTYSGLSARLADVAGDLSDPVLMLAAARLEAMSSTETESRDKTTRGDGSVDDEGTKTTASLYEKATELAGTNEQLLALIDASSDERAKGRTSGAVESHYSRVLARDTDIYRISFSGGRSAEVSVVGDGDTDLDLYVYDENGNLICSDTDYTDVTYCSWRPSWTGPFRIEIRNLGNVYNAYRLATN